MTWVMAGPSAVCKTVRAGFDSLPRLQDTGWWFRLGYRVGLWVLSHKRSAFWGGAQYAAFKHERYRNSPACSDVRAKAYKLMLQKHNTMTLAVQELEALRTKHVAMSKKLSKLRRKPK